MHEASNPAQFQNMTTPSCDSTRLVIPLSKSTNTSSASAGRSRILLQSPFLAPYRVPLFERLNLSASLHPVFAFGRARRGTALAEATSGNLTQVQHLSNVYLPRGQFCYQRRLIRVIRENDWDAILLGLDPRFISSLLACVIARRRNIPVVWWGHGIRPSKRYSSVYANLANRAGALILYSAQGKRALEQLGVESRKMFVAWNSLDTEEISRLRADDWLRRDSIIYVGRLIRAKKVHLLLLALGMLEKRGEDYPRLTVVGVGPEWDRLRRLSDDLGISSQVSWIGESYSNSDLASLYNSAMASISPGYVGLSAIQSLGFGVPVIFADKEPHSPEIEALIPGNNSIKVTSDNAEVLGETILHYCHNPQLLETLGRAGARKAEEEFSLSKMVAVFEDAIRFAVRGF